MGPFYVVQNDLVLVKNNENNEIKDVFVLEMCCLFFHGQEKGEERYSRV